VLNREIIIEELVEAIFSLRDYSALGEDWILSKDTTVLMETDDEK